MEEGQCACNCALEWIIDENNTQNKLIPGPDKDNFVEVGTEIAPGKTVCVIEAMKLFNEIDSEISGKIVKILVDNASPVEFDQPLFLVEKA